MGKNIYIFTQCTQFNCLKHYDFAREVREIICFRKEQFHLYVFFYGCHLAKLWNLTCIFSIPGAYYCHASQSARITNLTLEIDSQLQKKTTLAHC